MLLFHVGGFLPLSTAVNAPAGGFAVQSGRKQSAVAQDLSFNTPRSSFITNTNWQNYGGEKHAGVSRADAGPDAP